MAGIEFGRLAGRTLVARGPANVGLVEDGSGAALLLDSGNDDEAGRKLLRAAEAAGLAIRLIANTHSNADHCGGNAFIQSRTSCSIAATRAEAAFIETPDLEPSYLWGGFPLPSLRNKFLMAKPSRVDRILEPPCSLAEWGVEVVPLPGHFLAMVGFMTADRVFFAADSVASLEILDKYHVFYLYDVGAQLETLSRLESIEADWFVPSHAEPIREIAGLARGNAAKIREIADFLLGACARPIGPEGLLAALADRYGIRLNHAQHSLVGSTLRSYLAWLSGTGEVTSHFEDNMLLFARA